MRVFSGVLLLLLALPAQAEKFAVEADIFYFSEDDARVAALETEVVDDVLRFRFRREPDAIAMELARDEIANGNICLRQVESDLVTALREKKVRNLCEKLFKQEMESGFAYGSSPRRRPVCSLRVEARETRGETGFFLRFSWERSGEKHSMPQSRKLASVGRDQMPVERDKEAWKEAPIGRVAFGWKGLLKNGSCSLNEDVLEAFHEKYLAKAKERMSLAACDYRQSKRAKYMQVLQKQFLVYVPEEWLKKYRSADVDSLLRAKPLVGFTTVKECEAEGEKTADQVEALEEIAEKIADKYEISAMRPASLRKVRGLSSEY